MKIKAEMKLKSLNLKAVSYVNSICTAMCVCSPREQSKTAAIFQGSNLARKERAELRVRIDMCLLESSSSWRDMHLGGVMWCF